MNLQEQHDRFLIRAAAIKAMDSVNLRVGNSNHQAICAPLLDLANKTFFANRNPDSDRLASMRTRALDRILFPEDTTQASKDSYLTPIQVATLRFILSQRTGLRI